MSHFETPKYIIQAAVVKTTVEYSAATTLHGLQYIFESGKSLSISKALWLLVVMGATGFGIIWSYQECSMKILSKLVSRHDLNLRVKRVKVKWSCQIWPLQQIYDDWQSNPTVNYLKTTGLPLSDIDFPSITICGQGSIVEV